MILQSGKIANITIRNKQTSEQLNTEDDGVFASLKWVVQATGEFEFEVIELGICTQQSLDPFDTDEKILDESEWELVKVEVE